MELRSSRRRNENEYKELQITLNGMGFYEEGMDLQEMREIIDALQQSVSESETNFLDIDMERAMRESEMDFLPINNERVFNSTMSMGSSPCNSPEIPSQRIVIHADVHHPLDWSPAYTDEERLRRKRLAIPPNRGDNKNLLNRHYNYNEITEPDAKRIQQCMDCISIQQPFLIIDPTQISLNKSQNVSTSSCHSTNEISISNHGVIGPISTRPASNDSGVNLGSEHAEVSPTTSTSISSSSSSSSQLVSPNNNLAQGSSEVNYTSDRSFNSVIEILGPVSLRRPINDSGVNSFNETANISSSSWDFHMSSRSTVHNSYPSANNSLAPSSDNDPYESDEVSARGNIVGHNNTNTNGSRFISSTVAEASPYKPVYANGCNGDDDDFEHSEPSL